MASKMMLFLCLGFIAPIGTMPPGPALTFQHVCALRYPYCEFIAYISPFGFEKLFFKYFISNSANEAKEEEEEALLAMRIKIHAHIIVLKGKIRQNKMKMPEKQYKMLSLAVERFFVQVFAKVEIGTFTLRQYYSLALCNLLQIKFDLFKSTNDETFLEETKERPKCGHKISIQKALEENGEQTSEWMLTILMHFLPKRPNLMEFLKSVAQHRNEKQINEIELKIVNLIGFSRFALIQQTFLEKIGWPLGQPNFLFTILYNEFFVAKTKLGKWRAKIVLQKLLYDEWAQKFFEDEKAEAINRVNKLPNLALFERQINYIFELKQIWTIYSENFWYNEKIIRAKIDNLTKRNKGKNLETSKETLAAHRKEIFEIEFGEKCEGNEPKDTSLLRALSFCISESFAEYAKKIERNSFKINTDENLNELSLTEQLKMLICVSKALKRDARRDEIVAKMHFEKMAELVQGDNDSFKDILIEHKKMWRDLLSLDRIDKLKQLLAETEYFSAPENFLSSDDESLPLSAPEGERDDDGTKFDYAEEEANSLTDNEINATDEGNFDDSEIWEQNSSIKMNKLAKESAKNKTKNYYGRKEKRKETLGKNKQMEEEEKRPNNNTSSSNSNNNSQTAQKYYQKISKNKEQKKKN